MNRIRSIIIDDELAAHELLEGILENFFPNVEILASCEDLLSGVQEIRAQKPDLVFLDVEMPGESGLGILKYFNEKEVDFDIIFITAYNEYALQALRLSAVDYLLKPLQITELDEALNKVLKNRATRAQLKSWQILQENLESEKFTKITINTTEGTIYIALEKLLYLQADGAYTKVYCSETPMVYAAKKIKHFEQILSEDLGFYRVHRSFIVNLKYITAFTSSDKQLAMRNGETVPVSRQKISDMRELIQRLSDFD